MCEHDRSIPAADLSALLSDAYPGGRRIEQLDARPLSSSRRLRLWELPSDTHCPVVGVCLPMPVLRRLIGKALGSTPIADDYEFHVAAVAECGRRMPISEALQRELDRRYALTLRRFAQAKTTDALAALWASELQGTEVAGALWATLTHARCDKELRDRVCRDIHMLQHQAGACHRAELQRLDEMQKQHAGLARELATLKERHAREQAQRAAEVNSLQTEVMKLRGQLLARDFALSALQEDLAAAQAATPDLPARTELARRVEVQQRRIHDIERDRALWQQRAMKEGERVDALTQEVLALRARLEHQEHVETARACEAELADLRHKAVLCVGGRPASVPTYRKLIECTGGRFLHHDGGEEHNPAQLEANLAAADLVICQTGCVSHGAYWRVKDHCKRTGKQCVFVDKPSASSLARCLRGLDSNAVEGAEDMPGEAMTKS